MSDILTFFKLILYCVPFICICLLSTKINFKKEHRYRQVFLPFLALIYCIFGVIFLNSITEEILSEINWLGEQFSGLSFLKSINSANTAVFIVNTVLVLGFMIIKAMLFPFLMALAEFPNLAEKTSGSFYYVTDEDRKKGNTDIRYLNSKYGDAKRIIRAMYYAMIAVFAVLLVVTYHMTSENILASPFYPAFGIIVFGEIVAFLSGKTIEEKNAEESSDMEKQTEVDYDQLPEKYSELFPKPFICSDYLEATEHTDSPSESLLEKYKKEYEETLNQEAGLIYNYYSGSDFKEKVLDEGYLRQTRNILDGKSVIFFTQFYYDTTDYVFLPVVRNLMKRKRILVVSGHGSDIKNINQWFCDGIASVNGFDKIWKVDSITNADSDTSVMILDAKRIYDQKLLNDKSALLAETAMVFIIEPNQLLGTLQIGLSCLVSYLRKDRNDPQYVIYDRNCDGLIDSLSHVLNKSIIQVMATFDGTAKRNLLFWEADCDSLHHRLGLSSSRYLGIGTCRSSRKGFKCNVDIFSQTPRYGYGMDSITILFSTV